MVINVFNYYEQREALKRAAKASARYRAAQAKPKRVRPAGTPWYKTWACRCALAGMFAGELLWFFYLRQVPPAVTISLLGAWGILLGAALDWAFFRLRKILGALRGDRLSVDDVRALSRRR